MEASSGQRKIPVVTETKAVHLHVHSEYSLLDGACTPDQLVRRCAELEMPALGLTDHGVMNGAVEFYVACREMGIKPILGTEAYFVDDARERVRRRFERNHLTLLAASDVGFKNLVKLSSKGFLEGFRRGRPSMDLEMLESHSEGIICLTGCLQSRFCRRLVEGRVDEARAHADDLMQVFGAENVYFELQRNGIPEQDRANEHIVRIAGDVRRPVVGTADVHYLRREDYDHHAALLCIQTKSTLAEPKIRFDTNEFYLKSPREMAEGFAHWPEALSSTLEIAERCHVDIELGKMLLPRFPCPDGREAGEYLRELAGRGLKARYGDPPPAEALERLEHELEVILKMGFESYFLIVWDFVKYAKDNGIAVGPGRGSAAGSIVSYALNITDVDPLAYDLLFERFLNPERRSMPDIDIDFSTVGRERVISYVAEKYGRESVAQIITFGKMAPKAATRDAGRVLGYSYGEVDRIAKLIPEPVMGRTPTFAECLKKGQELRKAYDSDPDAHRIVDVARGLEGIVRNSSIHAAAVVIADRPLTEFVPLQLAEEGNGASGDDRSYKVVTQYSMGPIGDIGLLKMDFLGLRNLDVLESAVGVIERSTGRHIDLEGLPLDDPKTYEMLVRGDSTGVFQFESEGMRDALRRVCPSEFSDLIALVALYRPGALRYIDEYARGKRNPGSVKYLDERLKSITESTYGVTLFQEQNMEIAKQLAGFTGPQADDLRKAIGKKNQELMESMRPEFVRGCIANGVERRIAERLWADNAAAADYSFNKSHAACYALIAYRTAYLKANYPAEYMAAVISSVMHTKDKVPFFVSRCEEMGIKVLPPDINSSGHDFVVVEGEIRFGLDAVKNVGHAAVEQIIRARQSGGEFSSIGDFCQRVDSQAVNKRALESLVKCGAFDSTGASRKGLLHTGPNGKRPLELAQERGQKAQRDLASGQGSLLGELAGDAQLASDLPIPQVEDDQAELLRWEKETLGLFLSSHPLADIRDALRMKVDCSLAELRGRPDGSWVTVGGLIAEAKRIRTKRGEPMMFATLDDLEGRVEMLVFDSAYAANRSAVAVDQVVLARGRVDHKARGETKLVVQEITPFEPSVEELERAGRSTSTRGRRRPRVVVEVDAARLGEDAISSLKGVFEHFPGDAEVVLKMRTKADVRRLKFGGAYKVTPSSGLIAEVESVLGPGARVR